MAEAGCFSAISAATRIAVSAHALVAALPHCFTASPTFQRLGAGVENDISRPAIARWAGHSPFVTIVLSILAFSLNPGNSFSKSSIISRISVSSSKSPVLGCGILAPQYKCQPVGALLGLASIRLFAWRGGDARWSWRV